MGPTLDLIRIEQECRMINQIEPNYGLKEIKEVNKYLKSGSWITEHKLTEELEDSISSFVGRKFAVAVPNGTVAIYLSLLSHGVKKGTKVAVPNMTMIATVNAVLWAGGEPVLVDVDENMCMSIDELKNIKNLHSVIFVPLNGRTNQGLEIEKWCKDNQINLIEDSAHAMGSKYSNGKMCGSLGNSSIFSFTPHKIITMGQGGMVLTDDKKIYTYLKDLKTFNRSKDRSDRHKGFGLNFKITDLQAAFGLSQFKRINNFIENKLEIYHQYNQKIESDYLKVNKFRNHELPWFIDVSLLNKKNTKPLFDYLLENGIETRYAYPPLNTQRHMREVKATVLKNSKKFENKVLWLPSSTNLSKVDINFIADKLNNFRI